MLKEVTHLSCLYIFVVWNIIDSYNGVHCGNDQRKKIVFC